MRIICATILAAAMFTSSAPAQSDTEFTYQGMLNDGSNPADGIYNLDFSLWDALVGGTQIGSTIMLNSQTVTDGLFSVELDFGTDGAELNARWLEVSVNGTELAPRTALTAAPYSIHTRGINVDDSGFVGIGRSDAVTGWGVFGIHRPGSEYGGMYASTDAGGRPFYGYSTGDNDAHHYLEGTTGKWKLDVDGVRLTVTNEGKVGIGTQSPGVKLEVYEQGSITAIYGQSEVNGVYGFAAAESGVTSGVTGLSDSTSGYGVYGIANATSGSTRGVYGYSASTSGYGSFGNASALTGTTFGVYGNSRSTSGRGVYGRAGAGSGTTYGVYGLSSSTSGHGLFGEAGALTGINYGVYGISYSVSGRGMIGYATSSTGVNYGVIGRSDSTSGFDFYAGGAGANYGATSSRRWKNNIINIDNPLDKLAQLRGVYFDWDEEHGGQHDLGMIAEEVGKVLPEIVNYEENGDDAIGMDYSKMTPLLVEAVNTLHEQQRAKDAEIEELRNEIAILKGLVERLVFTHQNEDSK